MRRGPTLVEQPQDVLGVRSKCAACRGQADASAGTLEQLATKLPRLSAAIAEDTDGCVTTNSSAAAVTEPPRMTARNAVSWVSVIAISLGVKLIA